MQSNTKKPLFTTRDLALIAISTVALVVSAYVTVPFVLPFTLQTLAIFLSLFLLGGKRGIFVVLVYLLLGLVGLPVFSGFGSGVGAIMGPTGGYLIGFLVVAIIYLIAELVSKNNRKTAIFSAVIGLVTMHAIGTLWLWLFGFSSIPVASLIVTYVLPYFAMDIVKLISAYFLARTIGARLCNN